MNVPLHWLSEYVTLPKSESELTDKLTMVGHMLDKRKEVNGEVVIDLELRGNRADMFGMIGVARDVATIFNTPLTMPKAAVLPKTDPKMPLIKADKSIAGLVKRYIAVSLDVIVKPSPKWLADRLLAYGIDPINNVVDVTNYVMVETSHPMHAFDADKLSGSALHLRLAKSGEKFETIQQGTTLKLHKEDIAICDEKSVQCLTCIGGAHTKVTDNTKRIILETAVYDAANCRRTDRRHKVATEGGGRHEKHQDPHELPYALARAIDILKEIAEGQVTSGVSDYYPHPIKPLVVDFRPETVTRLVGVTISEKEIITILESLDFKVTPSKSHLRVIVPSFRTDIKEEADIVEEVVRIWGYEKIPTETLSGELPKVGTPAHVIFEHHVREILKNLQLNEVITSTLIPNDIVPTYEKNGSFAPVVKLINAPDPNTATLRPSLLPNLVAYAKRGFAFRQERIAFFELGKVYAQPKTKKYEEYATLGIVMGGTTSSSWSTKAQPLTFFDLKGVIIAVGEAIGVSLAIEPGNAHPSLADPVAIIRAGKKIVGHIGTLHPSVRQLVGLNTTLYCAEITLNSLMEAKSQSPQPYVIAPTYPPIVEDLSVTVLPTTQLGALIDGLSNADPLIQSVILLDTYENKRMLRITYADPTRTLTGEDVAPIRKKLIDLAQDTFQVNVNTQ
jgi:phenylalanyl-tRNA synthetase beta chain